MDKPVLTIAPSLTVEEGTMITMSCIVKSSYPLVKKYDFVKSNERIILNDVVNSTYSFKSNTTQSGYYKCHAHNIYMEKISNEMLLTVTGKCIYICVFVLFVCIFCLFNFCFECFTGQKENYIFRMILTFNNPTYNPGKKLMAKRQNLLEICIS